MSAVAPSLGRNADARMLLRALPSAAGPDETAGSDNCRYSSHLLVSLRSCPLVPVRLIVTCARAGPRQIRHSISNMLPPPSDVSIARLLLSAGRESVRYHFARSGRAPTTGGSCAQRCASFPAGLHPDEHPPRLVRGRHPVPPEASGVGGAGRGG